MTNIANSDARIIRVFVQERDGSVEVRTGTSAVEDLVFEVSSDDFVDRFSIHKDSAPGNSPSASYAVTTGHGGELRVYLHSGALLIAYNARAWHQLLASDLGRTLPCFATSSDGTPGSTWASASSERYAAWLALGPTPRYTWLSRLPTESGTGLWARAAGVVAALQRASRAARADVAVVRSRLRHSSATTLARTPGGDRVPATAHEPPSTL
jgi:hypothetical protein